MSPVSRRDFLRHAGTGIAGGSLLGMAGCGFDSDSGSTNSSGSELKLYVSADVPTLDPSKTESTLDNNINLNLLEGLYRFDPDSNPIPGQAKSVKISKDGLKYTFALREGIQWSDGSPVTAHDFKYSWLRALNPETAAPQSTDISTFVKGAREYNTGEGDASGVAIATPSERVLEVELLNPSPFFLQLVAHSATYLPLKQDFVEGQGDDFARTPGNILYNGAYKLSQFDPTGQIVFEKNPDYWDADDTAQVQKISLRVIKQHSTALNLYESGQLDQVQLEAQDEERYKGSPEYGNYLTNAMYYVYLNNQDPVIQNRNIRQALTMGFDRETLATEILGGGTWPAEGLVPPVTPGPGGQNFRKAQGSVLDFSPEKAREHWDRGVEELGESPSLVMLGNDDSTGNKVSQYMQGQYKKHLGIDITIERATFESFLQRASEGNYQIGSGSGWQGAYNAAQNYLEIFVSDHPQNFPHFKNAEYDDLIGAVKREPNVSRRLRLLMRAESMLLAEEVAIAPQYAAGIAVATKPHVKNWVMNMAVDVGNYKYWRLG